MDYYKDHAQVVGISRWGLSYIPESLAAPLRTDPLLPPAFNLLLVMLIVASIILLSMFVIGFRNSKKSPTPLAKFCRPATSALDLLNKQGLSPNDYGVCGSIIEICRSKRMFSDFSLSGWDCHPKRDLPKVTIHHKSGSEFLHFQHATDLDDRAQRAFNGTKYSLVETPPNYFGSEDVLNLVVQNTDFYATQTVQKAIRSEPAFALENGSIFPERQRQANSLCLHLLVQLADGNIICMKRAGNTAYASNKMSISCEEQLAQDDMEVPGDWKVSHWFKRALCEEIFPLGALQLSQLEVNWKKIEHCVTSMRVLSVFYEVDFINYALFGYCRINCTPSEFRHLYQELSINSTGRDKEGIPYLLSEAEALDFVLKGRCKARSVWGCEQIEFGEGTDCPAHPSSLYRLVQFLTATGALKPSLTVPEANRT
ncbi:hypothetical protein [Pseudopelagicola sp. nBUS_19]|uniref:hypothetical protein n=1 Tax=Pseudopelagicola sp. nBUS_19 TaxID=3395316 RepID=UPI003EB6A152